MFDAVVFDFDGVIVDTEVIGFATWASVFEEYGCALDPAEWAEGIGTRGRFNPYAVLRASVAPPGPSAEAVRRVRRRMLAAGPSVQVLPGVREWLEDCERSGVPVAIASSALRVDIERHLAQVGLADSFPVVSCVDGLLRPKPAPDTYAAACRALGVAPDRALAVEDSPHGIRAAKSAGLWCLAIPHRLTADLDLAAADLMAPSLAALALADVAAALDERPDQPSAIRAEDGPTSPTGG